MSWNKKRIWTIFKILLTIGIVLGVGWHFYKILRRPELQNYSLSIDWPWFLPAALLYLAAHTCWGTFWVQLLWSQGQKVSWLMGIRAYFVSQYGKYLPGKAWVIVLRVGILKRAGAHRGVVAVTATYETLTSMAAGAFLGVCLFATLDIGKSLLGKNVYLMFLPVAALPLFLGLLNRLMVRLARKRLGDDNRPLPSPSFRLLAQGMLQAMVGWCLLALSVACIMQGLGIAMDWAWLELVRLTCINCLAYVAGFVFLLAPGGVGVREGALQLLLEEQLASKMPTPEAAATAVVVALVLRLVWTVAELIVAITLQQLKLNQQPTE